jgi:hypothetical protein
MPLRLQGYSKYGLGVSDLEDVWDSHVNCVHLIVLNNGGGPSGCSRILFGEIGVLPLGLLTPLAQHPEFQGKLLCEASHFCVPSMQGSMTHKSALWRAGLHEALRQQASHLLLSTRKGGLRDYQRMLFRNLGSEGEYHHPKRGNRKHYSLALELEGIEERFAEIPPLHSYFFGSGKTQGTARAFQKIGNHEAR